MKRDNSILRLFGIALLIWSLNLSAQNVSLAMNYVEQGEYEKAKSIYKKLYEQNPRNQDYLIGLGDVYVQLKEFDKVEELFKSYLGTTTRYPNIMVELGQIYQIKQDTLQAKEWYRKAIDVVKKRSTFAYATGRAFQKYNLLDRAIETYEIAHAEQPRINYSMELARLYGEKGNQKLMFDNYINLIVKNQKYFEVIQRYLSEYISNDAQSESNLILKRLLLQKLQESPNILYNQILSWVFVQEQSFRNSLTQEKAIFKRTQLKDFGRLFDLAAISVEANDYEVAQDIYDFIVEESLNREITLEAVENQMQLRLLRRDKPTEISRDFLKKFELYGFNAQTLGLQLLYAEFLAFNLNQWENANQILEDALEIETNKFEEAQIQMLLADILVAQEQYNQALVKYTLVSKQLKNTPLAQEAKYKTAMASYYKGDFSWALTQLNVLKRATTQTIANDALEMALFIKQGKSDVDSTQQALKNIAKADLMVYQSKPKDALSQLDSLITDADNFHIIDQALYKKAKILERLKRYQEAATQYTQIIEQYSESIVVDNALYKLAQLQIDVLGKPEDAQQNLELLIFNHQDSIFFVEARKLYRKLREEQNL
jgi:tetratricopeptide (TPR) repeat protein